MKPFLTLLKKAINHYVMLDPESKKRLQALENKRVNIELLGPGVKFQLNFSQAEILIDPFDKEPADTYIKGTPLSLCRVAWTDGDRKTFFSDKDLIIEGDLDLAQQVMALFDELEIDWEEYLSRWVGDVAAHQMGRLIRGIHSFNQRASITMQQNINEYIHEEVDLFPVKEALEDFFSEVDHIRMDVDRIAARVSNIKETIAKNNPSGGKI